MQASRGVRALYLALIGALALGPVLGCDDEPADGDGDGDADGDADGDGDGDCEMTACHAPPYQITSVAGTVLDDAGRPWAGDLSALVCVTTPTRSQCLFADVDGAGDFSVAIPMPDIENVSVSFTSPDVLPLTPFCFYEELCDGGLELCGPYRLARAPTAAQGTAVGTDVELTADTRIEASDGGAVILPAGSAALPPIGYDWLALTRYDLDGSLPCFIESGNLPVALYAVTPADSEVIEPGTLAAPVHVPATIDVPNDTGLAAGTTLDVYVLGGAHGLQVGSYEGEWRSWTTATVTADGSRIRTADGDGISYLTWFALYPR
jgi:hypothetical protein